jgi:hypothetical protein
VTEGSRATLVAPGRDTRLQKDAADSLSQLDSVFSDDGAGCHKLVLDLTLNDRLEDDANQIQEILTMANFENFNGRLHDASDCEHLFGVFFEVEVLVGHELQETFGFTNLDDIWPSQKFADHDTRVGGHFARVDDVVLTQVQNSLD